MILKISSLKLVKKKNRAFTKYSQYFYIKKSFNSWNTKPIIAPNNLQGLRTVCINPSRETLP